MILTNFHKLVASGLIAILCGGGGSLTESGEREIFELVYPKNSASYINILNPEHRMQFRVRSDRISFVFSFWDAVTSSDSCSSIKEDGYLRYCAHDDDGMSINVPCGDVGLNSNVKVGSHIYRALAAPGDVNYKVYISRHIDDNNGIFYGIGNNDELIFWGQVEFQIKKEEIYISHATSVYVPLDEAIRFENLCKVSR